MFFLSGNLFSGFGYGKPKCVFTIIWPYTWYCMSEHTHLYEVFLKYLWDIGYLLWDFFKEPWGHLFIGYLILLACEGSDLVLLTEMNGKLVSHVLLSAYWHWQFSRLEKCQVRQHSLSRKFSCLLVSVMHLYTFTLQFALVS